jgi:hypothetical protein
MMQGGKMIICDIDGTAFNNLHRAHLVPEDKTQTQNWTAYSLACVDDVPVMPIINLVKHLANMHDNKITFVTSRTESAHYETATQLFEYFSDNAVTLHMRPMTDNRSPIDFKRAIFKKLLDQVNEHSLVIDDHAGIMDMVKINFPHVNRLLVESFDCTVRNPSNNHVKG